MSTVLRPSGLGLSSEPAVQGPTWWHELGLAATAPHSGDPLLQLGRVLGKWVLPAPDGGQQGSKAAHASLLLSRSACSSGKLQRDQQRQQGETECVWGL